MQLMREEAIKLLMAHTEGLDIHWEAFNPLMADSMEGECLLWLLACRSRPEMKLRFLKSFTAMSQREHMRTYRRRANQTQLRELMCQVKRRVKKKYPKIDIGQDLPVALAS